MSRCLALDPQRHAYYDPGTTVAGLTELQPGSMTPEAANDGGCATPLSSLWRLYGLGDYLGGTLFPFVDRC